MRIGNSDVHFVSSVKNLGVTLDCKLDMTQHVPDMCRSAYIQLGQIGSIRHLLIAESPIGLTFTWGCYGLLRL